MRLERGIPVLEQIRPRFHEIAVQNHLLEANVTVLAKPLTPEEAIGTPGRRDYPIITGKERILEARFLDGTGHAFTDSAREFTGTVAEVIDLALTSNQNRAIYVATLNAVLSQLGLATQTVHCKDDDPEECGAKIAQQIRERHGEAVVGLIGLNPAIADHLVRAFGADRVHISDLYRDNIGAERFGVEVWDGAARTPDIVAQSDVVLFTGTTLQNGTFDEIWASIQAQGKRGIVYGVTAAGVCALTGIERLCPCGREG
jgi:uncharacterized protein (DUF4213/DUF364 family)